MKIPVKIQNLLNKLVQVQFNETIWRRSPDLLLEVSDHIGCIMGYRPDMKIMCPYSCFPQQMGLGTLQINEIGEGHQISFLASINDFAILGQRVGISNFPLQIQNPLEFGLESLSTK